MFVDSFVNCPFSVSVFLAWKGLNVFVLKIMAR